jgi:hypothetical protein
MRKNRLSVKTGGNVSHWIFYRYLSLWNGGPPTGVQQNYAHFSADLITELFRVSTRGSAPNHNAFKDDLLYLIAWVRNSLYF